MTFNQKRYRELLKRSQDFKNQGRSFNRESEKESGELLKYQASIQSYVFWKNRRSFLLVMEKFVNRRISGEEFNDSFLKLYHRLVAKDENGFLKELGSEKLQDLQIDRRSKGFGSVISFLRAECDNFSEDYGNEVFYNSIKDCCLKLQKALNEE